MPSVPRPPDASANAPRGAAQSPSDRELGEATMRLLEGLSGAEMLAAITPERLGDEAGYSASSVRYRLSGGRGWKFDRGRLMAAMVDAAYGRLTRESHRNVRVYGEAISASLAAGGAFAHLMRAIEADARSFSPGAEDDATASAAATSRLFAVLACGTDPELARRVREHDDAWVAMYHPVYERVFDALGRRIRDGLTLDELAVHIASYLQAMTDRRRFDPQLQPLSIARGVIALIYAWTQPIEGQEPGTLERFEREFGRPSQQGQA